MKRGLILLIAIILIPVILASDVLVWQGQYYTGTTFNTGTYEFNFTVYDNLIGGKICYSNKTILTTGSFGEWKTEQYNVSSSCSNSSKDYYLNININGTEQTPRRRLAVWNFLRKNVDEITTGKLQTSSQVVAPVVQADSQIVAPVINSTQVAASKIDINEPSSIGSGGIGIGTSIPLAYFHIVQTTDSIFDVGMMSDVYINAITGSAIILRKARGTVANPLPLQAGDTIGSIKARGYGTTEFSSGGAGTGNMRIVASENWTDVSQGEYIQFQTNSRGENTLKERLLINESGIKITGNVTTADAGFFSYLGSLVNRITELFVQNINIENSIKIGNTTKGDCNSSIEGTIVYDNTGEKREFYGCRQKKAGEYEWVMLS